MLVAITGTPGVGKSTVSKILRKKYEVIDINSYAESHGLFDRYDEKMESYDVDVEKLNECIRKEKSDGLVFMDGHLSHFVDCDKIVVLRCDPDILFQRLKARGYSEGKAKENVQSEILDVILSESVESGIDTYEIDCSRSDVSEIAEEIVAIAEGKVSGRKPGSIDWSACIERYF